MGLATISKGRICALLFFGRPSFSGASGLIYVQDLAIQRLWCNLDNVVSMIPIH